MKKLLASLCLATVISAFGQGHFLYLHNRTDRSYNVTVTSWDYGVLCFEGLVCGNCTLPIGMGGPTSPPLTPGGTSDAAELRLTRILSPSRDAIIIPWFNERCSYDLSFTRDADRLVFSDLTVVPEPGPGLCLLGALLLLRWRAASTR